MKTLTLLLLLLWAANTHAQANITKLPDGRVMLTPARVSYEVKLYSSPNPSGPWFLTAWVSGEQPCPGLQFIAPANQSGQQQWYWKLVIIR